MEACSDSVAVMVPEIKENRIILPKTTDNLTLAHYVPVLQQYREINKTMVFDYREKKGNAAARSHVAKLRTLKAPLTEIHKRMKADYLKKTQQMDADKRDALAVVEEMIEHHDKELRIVAAEEAAEAQRMKIEAEIVSGWDLAHEMHRLFLQQKEQDRIAAEQARVAEEQAEKQRKLDQEEREKRITAEAAETARINAEAKAAADKAKSEADRKAAEEKVERDKQDAAEAAAKALKDAEEKAQREREELEAKHRRETEEAARVTREEEERKRQAEARAAADLENIKRVHWAIIPVLVEKHGMSEDQAKGLIVAIRSGEVPALSINYQWTSEEP